MKQLALIACALFLAVSGYALLAADNPAPSVALCGPFPKIYKETIWNWMQKSLVDANSAKIEWEGEPQPIDIGKNGQHVYGWLVKFKVNSRNKFGLYTGKQNHGAVIRDGQIIQTYGFGY